jgi:hypothetical protein
MRRIPNPEWQREYVIDVEKAGLGRRFWWFVTDEEVESVCIRGGLPLIISIYIFSIVLLGIISNFKLKANGYPVFL